MKTATPKPDSTPRPAPVAQPPGRPKDLEKRAGILEAAKDLFLARGFEATSMDAVAQAAGVSKLTVYNHFQDKDTLFLSAVKSKCEERLPHLLFSGQLVGSVREQLLAIARAFHALVTSPESVAMHRMIAAEGGRGQSHLGQLFYEAGPQRTLDEMQQFLEHARARGLLRGRRSGPRRRALLLHDQGRGPHAHAVRVRAADVARADRRAPRKRGRPLPARLRPALSGSRAPLVGSRPARDFRRVVRRAGTARLRAPVSREFSMRATFSLLGLVLTVSQFSVIATAADTATKAPETPDKYVWLEDVTGDAALKWVRERNATSTQALAETEAFKALDARLLKILDSDARIPYVEKMGGHYYNFWRDAQNPRGLWRRTTLAEYRKAEPAWETVIDLDALGKAEDENWVWHGADCLKPDYRLCLVSLSRGGADADVVREFDLVEEGLRQGRLQPARGQVQRRLDRRRHALRGHRFRRRLDDRVGLSAHRQGMEARHAAGAGARGVRGQGRGRRRLRLPRPHQGLRARLRQPRGHVLHR